MKFVFKLIFFVGLPFVVVGLPVGLALMAIERTPSVMRSARLEIADLSRAQRLMAQFDPRRNSGRPETITAREADLNTVLAAALSEIRGISGKVRVAPWAVEILASVTLPPNPLGGFVNLRLALAPSNTGFEVLRLTIGRIDIPPMVVRPALAIVLDRLVGAGKGDAILASIRSFSIKGRSIAVRYRPPPSLIAAIKEAMQQFAAADAATVRRYYVKLMELDHRQGNAAKVSLTAYVGALFAFARERSRAGDPVEENRAVIFALAIYFSDRRMERFIGAVRTGALAAHQPRIVHVQLGGRHDWIQHFTLSAGLALAGGSGLADIIGEAKEVEDTGSKSGFSFTDLAADRAGVRFAKAVVASTTAARRTQSFLAGSLAEATLFPIISDLPENLSAEAFGRLYGHVDSAPYLAMVREIDRRIDALPLYSLVSASTRTQNRLGSGG